MQVLDMLIAVDVSHAGHLVVHDADRLDDERVIKDDVEIFASIREVLGLAHVVSLPELACKGIRA